MTQHTHQTAPTQFVEANGIRFAYRRFGEPGGAPLVFNQHFRGTMDYWDPAVTDGLARNREVILFNNAGVSSSSGEVPASIQERGQTPSPSSRLSGLPRSTCLAFPSAAWSLRKSQPRLRISFAGSFLLAPGRAAPTCRRAIRRDLAGAYDPPEHLWLAVHFSPSPSGRAAGFAFLKRKLLRQGSRSRGERRSGHGAAGSHQQIYRAGESALNYLKEMRQPTLIVQGSSDVIVPTVNSYILQQNLPNAELIVYPDANHGSFYQYPQLFVSDADQFLTSALQGDDAKLQSLERLPFPSIVSASGV